MSDSKDAPKAKGVGSAITVLQGAYLGVVVASWHAPLTEKLYEGTLYALRRYQVPLACVWRKDVPGCFEIGLAVDKLLRHPKVAAVVALGCILKGETPHFHFLAQSVTQALTQLTLTHAKPIGWGIILADTQAQAKARAQSPSTGTNKGTEATQAVLDVLRTQEEAPPLR